MKKLLLILITATLFISCTDSEGDQLNEYINGVWTLQEKDNLEVSDCKKNTTILFQDGVFEYTSYDFKSECVMTDVFNGELVNVSGVFFIQLKNETQVLFNADGTITLNDTFSLKKFTK